MAKRVDSAERTNRNGGTVSIESVADILERELKSVIVDWLARVERNQS
jgi:hypothetical protein